MKCFLFCTSCIDNNLEMHTASRYEKWVNYYTDLREQLQVENIFMINDGDDALPFMQNFSMPRILVDDGDFFPVELSDVSFFYFKDRLGRPSPMDYQGWWRSFSFASRIAERYDFEKIIHIESDFFISGKRLPDYLFNLQEGWVSLYSCHYNFPESAIQVICKDQLQKFRDLEEVVRSANYNMKGRAAEFILSFTEVNKEFVGDRFGELSVLVSWSKRSTSPRDYDYFGQLPTNVQLLSPEQLQTLLNVLSKIDPTDEQVCFDVVMDFLSTNKLFLNDMNQ